MMLGRFSGAWYEGIFNQPISTGGKIMGKGDRRSRRGKIWRGSTGKYRSKKAKKTEGTK
jgi:30S ribosomal protein S31